MHGAHAEARCEARGEARMAGDVEPLTRDSIDDFVSVFFRNRHHSF